MTTGTTYAIDTLAPEDTAPVLTAIGALPGFGYWGDNRDWLIVGGWAEAASDMQRTLDQSNAHVMTDEFERAGCELNECYALENFGGAFGQGTHLTVKPNSSAHRIALELLARIADYPILDEEDWSEREYENSRTSLEWFATTEYPQLNARDLASWLVSAWMESGTRDLPGGDNGEWPDRENVEHRPIIAAAIRRMRAYDRSH